MAVCHPQVLLPTTSPPDYVFMVATRRPLPFRLPGWAISSWFLAFPGWLGTIPASTGTKVPLPLRPTSAPPPAFPLPLPPSPFPLPLPLFPLPPLTSLPFFLFLPPSSLAPLPLPLPPPFPTPISSTRFRKLTMIIWTSSPKARPIPSLPIASTTCPFPCSPAPPPPGVPSILCLHQNSPK